MHKPKRREAWTGEATVLANSMLALAQCWCVSCVSCVPLKLEAWSIDDGLVLNMPLFKASILTHFLLTSMWLFHVIYIFVPWYWYIKSAFDSGVQHRVQATSAGHLVFDPACNFRFFHPLSSPFFLALWKLTNWQIKWKSITAPTCQNHPKSRWIACKAASHPRMGISWCRKGVLR